jgi:CHAD domain-containing protein
MTSSPDPREFARARATSLLNALDFQLRQTLKTPDATQVHHLRVATRRFTQALVIFESCLRGVRGIREKLKDPMELSGDVRDFDIVLKILRNGRTGVSAKAVDRIERERAKAQRGLVVALGKMAKRGAIQTWRAKLSSPHPKTAAPIPSHATDVQQAVSDTAERFFDRGDHVYSASDSGAKNASPTNATPKHLSKSLHHLRIATKELRYTLELALLPGASSAGASSAGASSRNGLDRIEQLQSDLGDIHDFDPVHQILSEYRSAKKLLARLARKQHKRINAFRKYWKNEFGGRKNRAEWIQRISGIADTLTSSAPVAKRPTGVQKSLASRAS